MFYIVYKLLGFYVKAEYHTSAGRVDMVLQTRDKHYARPFAKDSRKLFKIGVNFSAETRNIEKWLMED